MKTNQEIFDQVAIHLMTQRRRAEHLDGRCVYHAEDGSKCAVGCLISDDAYSPTIEYELLPDSWGISTLGSALEASGVSRSSYLLLGRLQILHDATPPAKWRLELSSVAVRFGLTLPVLP